MILVISSDYHFSWGQTFDRPTDSGIGSRLREIIDSVLWAADVGKKHKATMFLSLGDVFDRAEKLPTKEGLAVLEMFKQVTSRYDKTFVIPGNHDQLSENHNILDLFSETMGLKVLNKPSVVDIEGARLFFLPYIRDPEDFYKELERFYSMDCPGKKYLFAHFWDSSIMAVDPEAIDLSLINLDFFDRVFTGHYHVPSSNMNSKVIYVGTLLNKRFNETGPKGAFILNTSKNTLKFHSNPLSPEFFTVLNENSLLGSEDKINTNAYYRISCSPENIVEMSKLLLNTKGYEFVNKTKDGVYQKTINLDGVEKKNNLSLKDYVLDNCGIFLPSGIKLEDFKKKGEELLAGM